MICDRCLCGRGAVREAVSCKKYCFAGQGAVRKAMIWEEGCLCGGSSRNRFKLVRTYFDGPSVGSSRSVRMAVCAGSPGLREGLSVRPGSCAGDCDL